MFVIAFNKVNLCLIVGYLGMSIENLLSDFTRVVGTDWPELALRLGFREVEVRCYRDDHKTMQKAACAMLYEWYDKNAPQNPLQILNNELKVIRSENQETSLSN